MPNQENILPPPTRPLSAPWRIRIEAHFERFGRFVFRHHWKILLAIVAVVIGCGSGLPKLSLDTSTEGFLHPQDPTLSVYNEFREQFGREELILVAVTGPDIFAPEFLARLRALHQAIEAETPHLEDITSLVNVRNTRGEGGTLRVEELLQRWPDGGASLDQIRTQAMGSALYRNMILSEDATTTALVIRSSAFSSEGVELSVDDVLAGLEGDTTDEATDTLIGGFDEAPGEGASTGAAAPAGRRVVLSDAENSELVRAVQSVIDRFDRDGFSIRLAGSPVILDDLKRSMETNLPRFTIISLCTISLLLALMFRRLSGVLLPLAVVVLSLLSTLGLMGHLGMSIKLPTQILPSFLLAVGVGASVHILAIFYRYLDQGNESHESIAFTLGHSGLAIVMTSLTTAAGLASFAGSPVAPISDLGFAATIGVLIALIFTLVMLPALLALIRIKPVTRSPRSARGPVIDRLFTWVTDFSIDHSGSVLALSVLLTVVGISGAAMVKFGHNPLEWFPDDEPIYQNTMFIDQQLKGGGVAEVVVDTGRENGLYEPAVMKELDRLATELYDYQDPDLFVGKIFSLSDMLKEINQALNNNQSEAYAIPQDRELIAQEFLLFENSGSDDLEDVVDSRFQKTRVTVKVPWADTIAYARLTAYLEKHFNAAFEDVASIQVTGLAALFGRILRASIQSMQQSYVIAALVITLMMILLIGDLRIGLVSMMPNLLPIVLVMGYLGWAGIQLDMFNMLVGSIALGLAVDDTVHFMHNYRRYYHLSGDVRQAVRETLLSTGRAMAVTTMVLATGFYTYTLADMNNLILFGSLTGSAIVIALVANFLLAPALMHQLHKRRITT